MIIFYSEGISMPTTYLGGYSRDIPRDTQQHHITQLLHLKLANIPDTPACFGQYARQHDSTPDLTWCSPALQPKWSTLLDAIRCDHFPIQMILHPQFWASSKKLPVVNIMDWNTSLTALRSHIDNPDFYQDMKFALKEATTTLHTCINSPPPDLHLLNLWASRLLAQ